MGKRKRKRWQCLAGTKRKWVVLRVYKEDDRELLVRGDKEIGGERIASQFRDF